MSTPLSSCSKDEPEASVGNHRPSDTENGDDNNGGGSSSDPGNEPDDSTPEDPDPNDPLSGGIIDDGNGDDSDNDEDGNNDENTNDGDGEDDGDGNQSDDPADAEKDPDVKPIIGDWTDVGNTTRINFNADRVYTSYKRTTSGTWTLTQSAHFDFSYKKKQLLINVEYDDKVVVTEYRCLIDGDNMTLYTESNKRTDYVRTVNVPE